MIFKFFKYYSRQFNKLRFFQLLSFLIVLLVRFNKTPEQLEYFALQFKDTSPANVFVLFFISRLQIKKKSFTMKQWTDKMCQILILSPVFFL